MTRLLDVPARLTGRALMAYAVRRLRAADERHTVDQARIAAAEASREEIWQQLGDVHGFMRQPDVLERLETAARLGRTPLDVLRDWQVAGARYRRDHR